MRKITVLTILLLSLFMISCDEDSNPSNSNNNLEIGEMTATVDGEEFEAGNALYYNQAEQVSGSQFSLATQSTKTISLSFLLSGQEIGVGTFTVNAYYQTFPLSSPTDIESWATSSGTAEITSISDEEIAGTFNFTGTNSNDDTEKTVQGSFRVSRQ